MEGVIHFNRSGPQSGDPIAPAALFRSGKKVPPDAVSLLQEDHRTAIGMLDWYEQESDEKQKAQIVLMMGRMLLAHMAIEEEIFYPHVAEAAGADDLIRRAVSEHGKARKLMEKALKDPVGASKIMAKLRKEIEKHIKEEETEIMPQAYESDIDVHALGRSIAARRVDFLRKLKRETLH